MYNKELSQVIIQVLHNAKEALEHQEKDEKWISITTYKEDNGGGISVANMERIFDPYFSTKESKNGVGLGLYMVRVIITQHLKGEIHISNTQEGVKVEILLPLPH